MAEAPAASPYLGAAPQAVDLAKARKTLEQGGLEGVPVAVKDIIVTADGRTSTAASRKLEPYESP